jgi:hypothetical protein
MTTTQHTTGPWEYREAIPGEPTVIAKNNACRVAETCEMPGQDENERRANARLIAAAPELLAALIELERVESSPHSETLRFLAREQAREAIAKATGEEVQG